ncbi:MAG: transposase [Gemmatimonadaceae bacterium]|nr:transposase [Gemmatimonadaceae bacterium]
MVDVLNDLVAQHGAPRQLRGDNGPGCIGEAVRAWCTVHGLTLAYIGPWKPNQHAHIERFNRSFREEVLDMWLLISLAGVRVVSEKLRYGYNTARSHESLGNLPQRIFLPRPTNAAI